MAGIHHVEIRVADFVEARDQWGWLLKRLCFTLESEWTEGQSWEANGAYLTLTTSPNLSTDVHDRRAPGVNHIACKAADEMTVDQIMTEAKHHGWRPLYQERYPQSGKARALCGVDEHFTGCPENSAGFKAEVVAGG